MLSSLRRSIRTWRARRATGASPALPLAFDAPLSVTTVCSTSTCSTLPTDRIVRSIVARSTTVSMRSEKARSNCSSCNASTGGATECT